MSEIFAGLFKPMPSAICPDCMLPTFAQDIERWGCCTDCWSEVNQDSGERHVDKEESFKW